MFILTGSSTLGSSVMKVACIYSNCKEIYEFLPLLAGTSTEGVTAAVAPDAAA